MKQKIRINKVYFRDLKMNDNYKLFNCKLLYFMSFVLRVKSKQKKKVFYKIGFKVNKKFVDIVKDK